MVSLILCKKNVCMSYLFRIKIHSRYTHTTLFLSLLNNVTVAVQVLDLPNRMDGKPNFAQKNVSMSYLLRQRYTHDVAKQL